MSSLLLQTRPCQKTNLHHDHHFDMTSERVRTRPVRSPIWRAYARCGGLLLLGLTISACGDWLPHVDLAPSYEPVQFVVPASWKGASPFVEAKPSDGQLRLDWWMLFDDPILDKLEKQAMAANPDLQAAAERFVQARDMMMRARSRRIPHLGLLFDGSDNKRSNEALFTEPDIPISGSSVVLSGLATWEPDFWSAIRNETRVEMYRAEERAADFGLARLSLQAEIASNYFTLRGYDAQLAVYRQSVALYKASLDLVNTQYRGAIASALDVARVESLLFSTQTRRARVQGQRQVTEQAIAVLLNLAPASFTIEPVDELRMADFTIPQTIPSTLLERRPDIAGMERRMAQANRAIGIARAAFYPNVSFRAEGGYEDIAFNLIQVAKSFWSYGGNITLPAFRGGYRRAQLQQSWSAYRETVDLYRSTVLNAFREVENNLSLTRQLTAAVERQNAAVGAWFKTQELTSDLYVGGLASSLELIYAQVQTLDARIDLLQIEAELLRSAVALVRALGGGWNRQQLPDDEEIQPFGTLQYVDLDKPPPAAGIDVNAENILVNTDLTKPSVP